MSVKNKTQQIPIVSLTRAATVEPKSFNEEKNTIEVTFTTGARVKRGGFFTEPFIEELEVSEKAIDLSRLKAGAPFLRNHFRSVEDVLGVSVDAAVVEGKRGVATVQLSTEEIDAPIVNKIKAGIIRNVSVGYSVQKFKELDPTKDGTRVFRAIKWTPAEISAVAIGADPKSQVRDENLVKQNCEFEFLIREQTEMKPIVTPVVNDPNAKRDLNNPTSDVKSDNEPEKVIERTPEMDEKEKNEIKKEAKKAEKTRQADIHTAVKAAGFERSMGEKFITDDIEIDAVRKQIIDELAKKSDATPTANVNATIVRDEKDTMIRGMENSMLSRFKPGVNKLDENGKRFINMSMLDQAREILASEGVNVRNISKSDLAERALLSGSDYPVLLENIAIKTLRDAYNSAPKNWGFMTSEGTLPDFKEASRVQMGDAPELELVGENGEIKQGAFSEAGEKISLLTYAKMVCFSRKMLINDDLGAFLKMPEKFGRRAAQKEADLIWAILLDNANLSDGFALFSADHKNIGTSGPLDPTDLSTLSELRLLARKQKGLDGERITMPIRRLVVPPELETKANVIATNTTPNKAGDVNDFGPEGNTSLQVVVEDRLSDTEFNANASATRYFATGVKEDVDMLELDRLEGESGPSISTKEGFEVDGLKIKARHEIGVKALEFRAFTRNAGV